MASKRAQRRRECERKARYATHPEAVSRCWGGLIVYPCPHCGGWHVGHPRAHVTHIDWVGAARDLRQDYSSVEVDGRDYWYC